MTKLKLTIIGIITMLILATSVFAATIVTSGSEQYVVNQVIIGCDNNVAQKLKTDLYLDSDDCISPGESAARIKLIKTGTSFQFLLVGDSVGLETVVEVLRYRQVFAGYLQNPEVIVKKDVETGEITVIPVGQGFATSTVPTLTNLGEGNYRYEVDLSPGWNFISFPIVLDDASPDNLFGPLRSKINRVYSYDPATTGIKWIKWNPELGAPSEITQIVPQRGYIIYMDESAALVTQGRAGVGTPEVPPSLDVAGGWNLLTVHGFLPRKMSSALNSIKDKYDSVWTVINNQLVRLEIGDDPELQPGQTYWIHLTGSGTLVP